MNPILLALLQAGRIAGPLASRLIKPIKTVGRKIDNFNVGPKRHVNRAIDYGKLRFIHPYGTIGGGLATNAYLYGGLVHDAKTGSLGPAEKNKLKSIWNKLDYNRERLEGNELERALFEFEDFAIQQEEIKKLRGQ